MEFGLGRTHDLLVDALVDQEIAMKQNEAAQLWMLIKAWGEGKTLQTSLSQGQWIDQTSPDGVWFNLDADRYRIKPEPAIVPWDRPEDVPGPVCFVSMTEGRGWSLVIAADETGIEAASIDHEVTYYSWSDLRDFDVKHSTDRVNWKPCTKLA